MNVFALLEPVKTIALAAAVFVPVERLAAERPKQPILRRGVSADFVTGVVNAWCVYAVLLVTLSVIDGAAQRIIPGIRAAVHELPLYLQITLAIVVGDLGVYVVHRVEHTIPVLWRFHVVHHSAEEMDWLVAVRHHPVDLFLQRIGSLAPLAALNLSSAAFAAFILVFSWQSWLVHANIRLPYGALRWLLVSPDFHHWHHSSDRAAHDKNFASLLACWDVVFGTVHLPAARPTRYGVEEPVPWNWSGRMMHPFHRPSRG